jgi:dTDP-4-dehydrorhamnose reductase
MSPRRRILVTGASGLLGGRVVEVLAGRHDVIAMRHRAAVPPGVAVVEADLLAAGSLERALESARPEVVVHSAALADADRCEAEPDRARRSNVDASAALARLCRARGVRIIALSTDLVLAGDRAWTAEDVSAAPVLVYGRTKLDGEEAILAEAADAAVLRVALVLGRGFGPRTTASEGIASALAAGRGLHLLTDQYRTPIDADSVADAVHRLLERPLSGRLNLGGAERLSRYELGRRVARVLGLPTHGIEAVSGDALASRAPRPADTSLDSSRARRELDWRPRELDDAIRDGRRAAV